MGHYLGLDSSTQSLTALVIDTDSGEVICERSLNFGERLPAYGSPNGFLPHDDAAIRHADPLMWVEALELLLGELCESGLDPARIRGISGAGQQHGSVYLARSLSEVGRWDPERSLRDQVAPLLSRATSPIWMDSSTTTQCREIAEAVGGDATVCAITGSRAIERFTAAQIRAFAQREPEAWGRTREVHLVSSFMASLLIGRTAGIDLGDGAGMNLLDLRAADWSAKLLEATAPDLGKRLAPPIPSPTVVGEIGEFFVRRYGFATGTPVVAFTGDNPSSLVGMGAATPGTAVISLGTSDTVFAAMREPRTDPRGYGHVFGNPAGGFMSLICFANGSLARERIARQHGLGWGEFEQLLLERTSPGNDGNLLLPFFVPEMTPKVLEPVVERYGHPDFVAERDAAASVRAIVEAQALSMRLHSDWIGQRPDRIRATGGASRNRGILQVLADVMQAELAPLTVANSSALGAALRAAEALEGCGWEDLSATFSAPEQARAVEPRREAADIYAELGARFAERLAEVLARKP